MTLTLKTRSWLNIEDPRKLPLADLVEENLEVSYAKKKSDICLKTSLGTPTELNELSRQT